jgi:hypothetical protein
VVPTISFKLLYGFVLMNHGRRKILYLSTTAHPSAGLIARQLTKLWVGTPRHATSFVTGTVPIAKS